MRRGEVKRGIFSFWNQSNARRRKNAAVQLKQQKEQAKKSLVN
jgi:hypothetical protein